MSILSPAIKSILKLRLSAIQNFVLNPIDTQKQVFNDLIGSGQYTVFGKEYDFENINTFKDFARQVPVNDYDTLKPYIDRNIHGEQNILWNENISWFAKSSGTTSDKSKFIPISPSTLKETHYKSGQDVLALYLAKYPQSQITSGKCLAIGGSHQINQLSAESSFGDLSAVLMQNMPFIGQIMRAPELSIALMDEWEAKLEAITNSVIEENITYMAGVPTWCLVLLKKILEKTGKRSIKEVWPNFELYIHGGVSFAPYRSQFEELMNAPDVVYMETYNASEGFFAAQDDWNEEGMLLFLNHGIYYEFMPISELGAEQPITLTLKEVEQGVNYAMIISSNAGLWRYQIGDTVQFTSLSPFRIKVSGRVKSFINAFGEEVIVDNSDNAIKAACECTGARVLDYTAAPVYMSQDGNGAHEWLIEFDHLPVSKEVFMTAVDEALQRINSDYEAKRHKDIALRMPIIHEVPRGGFSAWLKSKGKLGGQHKVPRLNNDRKVLEEILQFLQLADK